MYVYAFLLAIGIFGIVGMGLAGFLHIGPHHGAHGGGHLHGGHGHLGHGHGALTKSIHTGTAHGQAHGGPRFNFRSLISFSPLDIFSYCAGAGFGAFLLRPYMQHRFLFIAAILGALVFDIFITRAIMSTISKFGADPSTGLEGSVATEGIAETNFDSSGQGLVKLTLDGQIVQLLATLEPVERNAGVKVRRGDAVLIVQVDAGKNRCTVTRELADTPIEQQVLKLEGKS